MKTSRHLLKHILHPPLPLSLTLVFSSAAMLIYTFYTGTVRSVIAYVSYLLSSYSLAIVCVQIPVAIRFIKSIRYRNRLLNRYFTDVHFRTRLTLFLSHAWNTAYAALLLFAGLYSRSHWFCSLAAYYAMLSIVRWSLLKDLRNPAAYTDRIAALRKYRGCGIILLLINQALAVIVTMIVYQNRGFSHNYIITIAMAVYTFIAVTLAIKNLITFRRYNQPLLSAAKIVSFTSAMVSLISLETSMIAAFSVDSDPIFRRITTALTGAAVCTIVLVMAILMIRRSTKEIKKLSS